MCSRNCSDLANNVLLQEGNHYILSATTPGVCCHVVCREMVGRSLMPHSGLNPDDLKASLMHSAPVVCLFFVSIDSTRRHTILSTARTPFAFPLALVMNTLPLLPARSPMMLAADAGQSCHEKTAPHLTGLPSTTVLMFPRHSGPGLLPRFGGKLREVLASVHQVWCQLELTDDAAMLKVEGLRVPSCTEILPN